MKYHKEDKKLTLKLLGGDLFLSVSKDNRGLHISSGQLSILIDSLEYRASLSGENHWVVSFLASDLFIGCFDIYDFKLIEELNSFFPVNGFNGIK